MIRKNTNAGQQENGLMNNITNLDEYRAKKKRDEYLQRVMEARLISSVFPDDEDFMRQYAQLAKEQLEGER